MGELENRALRILRNLPKRLVATLRHQAEVEIDSLMASALKAITILSRSKETTDKMMVEAWEIYSHLQKLSGKVANKFLDNDHNNPLRVESSEHRPSIKSVDWNKFYNSGNKPFNQYYRNGGKWKNGKRKWKSQTKT